MCCTSDSITRRYFQANPEGKETLAEKWGVDKSYFQRLIDHEKRYVTLKELPRSGRPVLDGNKLD